MVGEVGIIILALGATQATAPGPADPAFPVALVWIDAVKRNDVAAVLKSTSQPFAHRSTGLKPKCERSTKTSEGVSTGPG
jgi:hypothetical protein